MESGEVKVEAEDLMSKDEENLVENNGEINVPKEERSVHDGSITESVKVRKRGWPRKNYDENKNQGCGESNGLCMKTGESEGKKKYFRRNCRMKREKGLDGIKKEEGLENEQEDVDMRENGEMDVGVGENGCNMGDSEKSKDLVHENGGPASAVEEGKAMDEDKNSLGEGLKETDVSSSAEAEKAECSRRKELEEENLIGEKEEGNDSEKENSKVEIEGQSSKVRESKRMAMEKIGKLSIELKITENEDEGVSMRGKRRGRKKKNNDGTSLKENEVGAKIAQMEDEKTKQRRSSLTKGTGDGEGKELNVSGDPPSPSQTRRVQDSVTRTKIGWKKDDNVGRIWKSLS